MGHEYGDTTPTTLERRDISAGVVFERKSERPTDFADAIEAAETLGHDVQVDCHYELVTLEVNGAPKLRRVYELTIWAQDTAAMRESLANVELQRSKRDHPAGTALASVPGGEYAGAIVEVGS